VKVSDDSLPRKTIRIMEAVAPHVDGIGLSEIARVTGIPKATCYRILTVLEEDRWLSVDPETRRYRVSFGLVAVVSHMLERGSFRGVRATLERLTADAKETSGFDVLGPPSITVVIQVPGPQLIAQAPRPVPRTQSVWQTASGKAALALLSREEVEAQFRHAYEMERADSPIPFDTFVDSLAAVRERGYAYAIDELEPGAAAVASAIRAPSGSVYAVWVGGPSFRITRERLPELGALTNQAATEIERLIRIDEGLVTAAS